MPAKRSYTNVITDIHDSGNNEYLVLTKEEDYKNVKTKIEILHKTCGNIYSVTPDHFLSSKNRCPFCSKHRHFLKTTDIFKQEIFDIVGNEYTLLSEYKNSKEKVKLRHNKCGNEYYVLPGHFLNTGTRCPNCYESREERKIKEILLKSNITFSREYTFRDL
jgi:hypothetical protein